MDFPYNTRRASTSQILRTINDYNENQRLYHENMRRMIQYVNDGPVPAAAPTAADRIIYHLSRVGSAPRTAAAAAGPTPEQIRAATENLLYNSATMRETVCPISLEQFQEGCEIARIRHCGHIFHRTDLNRWFSQHFVCPVCRHNIIAPAAAAPPPRTPNSATTMGASAAGAAIFQQLMSLFDVSGAGGGGGARDGDEIVFEFPMSIYPNSTGGDGGDGGEEDDT